MGDRVNYGVRVSETSTPLYVYSQWGGSEAKENLAGALLHAQSRLSMADYDYAMRIIVSRLVGSNWESETGFGLSVGDVGTESDYRFHYMVNLTAGIVHMVHDDGSFHGGQTVGEFVARYASLQNVVTQYAGLDPL